MNEFLKKVVTQISEFVRSLSPAKRIGAGITAVLIVFTLFGMFKWASKSSYLPLMTNLSGDDSAQVIRILREKKIPFRVDPTGKNVEIPPEYVYDLRLELATMGLPENSTAGYELFDKQNLGTTSYVQKINRKRALEGELMRTIGAMKGVKRARVHLALPERSAFVEDQKSATASVVLDLEPGVQLNEKNVFGIGTLVAKAVEGMDVSDVSIMDSNGKVISKNSRDPLVTMSANQIDFKLKFEQDQERSIETMLSKIVGEGRVVAKVSAEFDFSSSTETQTILDQDGATPVSVHKDDTSAEGSRPAPVGAPGVASNSPDQPENARPVTRTDTKRSNEVVNYEIPKTLKRTSHPAGGIKKLSVAIVVDGKKVQTKDADGNVLAKTEPWSAEEVKKFETIITSALGLNAKRGDTLEIKNMDFSREDFDAIQKEQEANEKRAYYRNLSIYLVSGLVILLFFLFVVRPFIQWLTENSIETVDQFLPQTIEELERFQKNVNLPGLEESIPMLPEKLDPTKIEGEMIKEKIITIIENNPHKAALILKDWIKGESAKKADGDKNKTA